MEALEYELNKCLSGRGVAVAQILGMTTDANIVATLNPGISMRNLDEGMVPTARAATSNEVWDTRSGISRVMKSGPVQVSQAMRQSDPAIVVPAGQSAQATQPTPRAGSPNQFPRAQTPSVSPRAPSVQSLPVGEALPEPTPAPVVRRSGMAVFGWIMLVLLILGGGAAAYYYFVVMQNAEQSQPASSAAPQPVPGGSGSQAIMTGSQHPPVETAAGSGSSAEDEGTPGEQGSGAEVDDRDHGTKNGSNSKRPKAGTPKHPVVAASSNPIELLREADKLEKAGDWDSARVVWEKLERTKGYNKPGMALFKQAWAAFQIKDTATALQLAQKAAGMRDAPWLDTRDLIGDCLFKQGEYDRAKEYYLAERAKLRGAKQTQVTHKIVACNKALGKPERDGIVGN
jgi:hypothetical protein